MKLVQYLTMMDQQQSQVSDVNIDDLTDDDEFSLDVEAAEDAAEGDADSVTVAIVTTQVDSVDDSDYYY